MEKSTDTTAPGDGWVVDIFFQVLNYEVILFQGICDILVPGEFINDDTLTIVCEMTLPGNDVTKLGYTYNAEVEIFLALYQEKFPAK